MNIQSKIIISILLVTLIIWILRNFINKKLGSGQTIFWLFLLLGAEVLTLFPSIVDWISKLWGNLIPVSWISFVSFVCLIAYLLYQSIKINKLQERLIQLTRSITFLDKHLRETESSNKQNPETTTP